MSDLISQYWWVIFGAVPIGLGGFAIWAMRRRPNTGPATIYRTEKQVEDARERLQDAREAKHEANEAARAGELVDWDEWMRKRKTNNKADS